MNKKVLLMLLSAAVTLGMQARHLTPDEALSRALNQSTTQQNSKLKMAPAVSVEAKLIYSADVDNRPMAYVFANADEQGFMVVSADDMATPILGYSDSSAIDPDNMPDNLRAWLDGYARQIAYAANNAAFSMTPAATAAAERVERATVAPKLTTTWNQDSPYWNECPTLNGSRCYTGCVATAMAQVMNYHQWPEKGQSSIRYYWTYGKKNLTCNFADITFEWDKMLDRYTSSSPADNCAAVAKLMMACGYASEMQYTPYASGTTGYSAAEGMINYFNYDKSLIIQSRDWYNADEWEEIVYTELTTNGPVYYDGQGSDGGHAFVCDGYRSNGYFHFNWGWGGLSDGYFLLNALNPGSQGAGGNTSGFNYDQSIMQNVSKPKAGSSITPIIATCGGFTTSTTSTTTGRSVTFTTAVTGSGYGFFSFSVQPITDAYIGIKYVDNTTGATNYITSNYSSVSLEPLHGFIDFPVTIPRTLSNGTYTVTPAFRIGSQWYDMKGEGSYNNAVIMTINGSTATFANAGAEAKVKVTDVVVTSDITPTTAFNVRITVSNVGTREFNGMVEARFLNAVGSVVDQGEAYLLTLNPGQSGTVVYTSTPQKGALHEGTYNLRFYSSTSGQYLSEPVQVKVIEPEPELILDCSRLRLSGTSAVDCNNVVVSATVTCESGSYTGPIAFIASTSNETLVPAGMFLSDEQTFKSGESKSISFSGVFEEGVVGNYYYAALAYKDSDGSYKQIGTTMTRFRVGTASGIDDIAADKASGASVIYPNPAESIATLKVAAAIKSVEVYSLSGALLNVDADINDNTATLNVSTLSAGTYIVVATGHDGTRNTAKLIKR